MVIAGRTGGIATGKSTVASFFRAAGAHIIDADRIAFDVVQSGTSAWNKIIAYFGKEVLLPNGQIDRVSLGDIIFQDARLKDVLNSIVHPEVFREIQVQLVEWEKDHQGGVVILDIPLLIETKMCEDISEVILVYVPRRIQLVRLMERNGLDEEAAGARIQSQMSIEEKKACASIIIDNTGSLEETKARTFAVYNHLVSLPEKA